MVTIFLTVDTDCTHTVWWCVY